jgi:hypothetical protein
MKEHHQRKLERIASELDGHLFIKEHKDWHGRRVRRVGFDYVPEEFKEDWEGTDDWEEEFESARLESIARGRSWLKDQQEAAIRKK